MLIIKLNVWDAEHPERKIILAHQEYAPPFMTEDEVIAHAYYTAQQIEMHEVKEFFKVNGRHYIDPHPDRPHYNS